MEFRKLTELLRANIEKLIKNESHLFETSVDKDELYELYLNSFPEGTNNVFRERREYDCSSCKSFIRHFGNVVVLKDNKMHTIWDFNSKDETYQPVLDALSNFVKSKSVSNIYLSNFAKIGTEYNFESMDQVVRWYHFSVVLPNKFINISKESIEQQKGGFRDVRNVFKRSLDEITEESVSIVLELIAQNSLYKGQEWKHVLTEFLKYKAQYSVLKDNEKENYAWEKSVIAGSVIGKIRNHSIGTLLSNISENMELDIAVKKYEAIVAPENYRRSQPIYSQKMLDKAKEDLTELGFLDSLHRRFAHLDDITINNILFADRDSLKVIKGNIFDDLSATSEKSIKKFSGVEEISIEDFIQNVLPTTKKIEVFLENNHMNNFSSLLTAVNKDSKTMFKWNNQFSWAYSGNITDSSMKQNVKSAGGNVEGVLRFSIQWNDTDKHDGNDLDAHCIEPQGGTIYFGHKVNHATTGQLDVDIIRPQKGIAAVENITWIDIKKMQKGVYKFIVHCYNHNGGTSGFRAEIEFNGQIYSFDYNKDVRHGQKVDVAHVTLDEDNNFSIVEKLPSSVSSRKIWGLDTNQFHNVGVVCYSPNYWDEQQGIGHKHYMFLLKNCINPENPSSFFNEYLVSELNEHRKVIEAMGSKLRVEDDENQLSGLGFSSTRRSELIVRLESNVKRVVKIKF